MLILLSLSDNNKADVIEEFGSTLGYVNYVDNLIDVGSSFL